MGIGDEYHEYTKHTRSGIRRHRIDWSSRPEPFLFYRAERIKLPPPDKKGGMPIWECITKRRSRREFTGESITLKELSQLLYATQGITGEIEGYPLRAAPSAGALYPIETYLVVNRVEDIDAGIYHYNVLKAELELLERGDFSRYIASAALEQDFLAKASVVFVWTAIPQRTKWKYGERGWRYIYKDAAHICQNLYLAATALNLGCCAIGACFDDEVNEILGIDGEKETVIYLAGVGKV